MTTEWKYRINVIIPIADQDALNALWTLIAPEGDSEARTFGVPLSADGAEPASHRGISTAATEYMRLAITELFAAEMASAVVSVQDYRENDWEALLAANGLMVVQPEVMPYG